MIKNTCKFQYNEHQYNNNNCVIIIQYVIYLTSTIDTVCMNNCVVIIQYAIYLTLTIDTICMNNCVVIIQYVIYLTLTIDTVCMNNRRGPGILINCTSSVQCAFNTPCRGKIFNITIPCIRRQMTSGRMYLPGRKRK